MFDVNIEFKKGILFVKLSGTMKKDNALNIKNSIINILNMSGIKYIVFNILDLDIKDGKYIFDDIKQEVEKNNGKMIICRDKLIKYKNIFDELKLRVNESC